MKKVLFFIALAAPLCVLTAVELPNTSVSAVNLTDNPFLLMPDTIQLAYDEGMPVNFGFKLTTGDRMAVRFTPPSHPFKITQACYVPIGWQDDPDNWNAQCDLVFLKDGAEPGISLGKKTVSATIQGDLNWFDVSSLNLTITSGGFYYGVENKADDNPGLALDGDPTKHHVSWMYVIFQGETSRKWSNFDNIDAGLPVNLGDTVDLILRVKGDAPGIGEIVLEPDRVELVPASSIVASKTSLSYTLPSDVPVVITLLDASGRTVSTLLSSNASAGSHTLDWNTSGLSKGVYFVQLATKDAVKLAKVVLAN